jgi:hypothetical protein
MTALLQPHLQQQFREHRLRLVLSAPVLRVPVLAQEAAFAVDLDDVAARVALLEPLRAKERPSRLQATRS